MKQIIITFLLLLLLPLGMSSAYAQQKSKIHGISIWHDPTDQDAAGKHAKTDPNGNLYALVKVRPAVEGFTFKFRGVPNLAPVVHDDGTWIYVQKDAKVVTINRDGYQGLINADMKLTLEAGKTYIMNIKFDAEVVSKGYLKFRMDESLQDVPAVVSIKPFGAGDEEYTIVGTMVDGEVSTNQINCVRYQYRVSAPNYSTTDGIADLLTADETKEVSVSLKPNFGFLKVTDPIGVAGAEIYVNNEKIGTVPYTEKRKWESGTYRITIHKNLYKDLNTTFTIVNGETAIVEASLRSDGASITLQVDDAEAEIFVDGKSFGKGKWVGPMRAGKYRVECRRADHYSTTTSIEVVADHPDGFLLDSPKPITGKLAANCRPEATITVDGQEIGKTPRTIPGLSIGSHRVTFTRPGYKVETREVTIRENETEELSVELNSMGNVTFKSRPSDATIWIDGKKGGQTPYTTEMAAGTHEIRLQKQGYTNYSKQVKVDPSKPEVMLNMSRMWVKRSSFYIEPVMQVGASMAYGANLGGYISGVNLEGYFYRGIGKSEDIWWSKSGYEPMASNYNMAMSFGGRVGWGFIIGTRFRVTPQLGAGCVSVSGDQTVNGYDTGGTAINCSLGSRCEFAITRWMGVSLTPEYSFPVVKNGDLTQISSVSSKIKGWCGGFNCRLGVTFNF